ncbi:MAG: cytochrome c oxidase accessory protein CcoG [Hyphomicrobiales bacterium]|nr:cytochrome c oxidase accessory protein CcoG [Hyphomicrobiales bacterium]
MAEDSTLITGPLYAARKKVYPQATHGTYRRIKWGLLIFALAVYYFLPFVRWHRGGGLPDQAVMVDMAHRRFYFFFIQLWPQEVYFFTGLLVIAAMALFLMNALAGRVWCGYLCPQTVWTDLFYAVERWIEGDRRDRIMKDKKGWTFQHIREVALKHFIWLMIAWWTGGAWVLYFADAPTLVKDLATFQAPFVAYLWIGILTAATYVFAGHMREQVCLYMCPWPRIQAALTDEWALNVTYRRDRGEPRMSVKKADAAHLHGQPAGDCIDCNQCVAVCPTGTDIRNGIQLGCVQCGLCIDACDNVMKEIGRPPRLIAYDTDINMARRKEGKPAIYRPVRARTILYACVIAVVGSVMLYALTHRSTALIAAQHNRNPLFVALSDGSVRNDLTVHISNKGVEPRTFALSADGLGPVKLSAVGVEPSADGKLIVNVAPDEVRDFRLSVTAPGGAMKTDNTPFTIVATDAANGETLTVGDHFFAPK